MSAPNSNEDVPNPGRVEPAEPIEPEVNLNQPNPPDPPTETPQTFKCDKCGATFTDAGSAAAHMQTCKGVEEPTGEHHEEEETKPIPQPASSTTPSPIA